MNRKGFPELLLLVILAGVLALGTPLVFFRASKLTGSPTIQSQWTVFGDEHLGIFFQFPVLPGTITHEIKQWPDGGGSEFEWTINRADTSGKYEFAGGIDQADWAHGNGKSITSNLRWNETDHDHNIAWAGHYYTIRSILREVKRNDGLVGLIIDPNQDYWLSSPKVSPNKGDRLAILNLPSDFADGFGSISFYFYDNTSLDDIERVLRSVVLTKSGSTSYWNTDYGFVVSYPAAWTSTTTSPSADNPLHVSFADMPLEKLSHVKHSIAIDVYRSDRTANEYAAADIEKKAGTVLSQRTTNVDGAGTSKTIITASFADGVHLLEYAKKGDYVYIADAPVPSNDYLAEVQGVFDNMTAHLPNAPAPNLGWGQPLGYTLVPADGLLYGTSGSTVFKEIVGHTSTQKQVLLDVGRPMLATAISEDRSLLAYSIRATSTPPDVGSAGISRFANGDTVIVRNLRTSDEFTIYSDLQDANREVNNMHFSPDGKHLFVANNYLWDADLQTKQLQKYNDHNTQSFCPSQSIQDVSSDGSRVLVITGCEEGSYQQIIDVKTGAIVGVPGYVGEGSWPYTIQAFINGKISIGSYQGTSTTVAMLYDDNAAPIKAISDPIQEFLPIIDNTSDPSLVYVGIYSNVPVERAIDIYSVDRKTLEVHKIDEKRMLIVDNGNRWLTNTSLEAPILISR